MTAIDRKEVMTVSTHTSHSSRRSFAMILVAGVAVALALSAYKVASGSGTGNPVNPKPTAGTFADLARTMSAINHSRGASDALTPAAAATANKMSTELPSNADQNSMRVFTSPPTGPVYVLPATNGFALVTAGGGGLIPGRLSATNPVAGGAVYGTGSPGWLFGIAEDNVTAVDVVIGSTTYKAHLTGNGYFWVAPDSTTDVRSATLLVHLSDGTVVNA